MTTYARRPERERVEAFRIGHDEWPGWFADAVHRQADAKVRLAPGGARYQLRIGIHWLDVEWGDYVINRGPGRPLASMGAERFEWLYREHAE